MTAKQFLQQAESDISALRSLPAEIRDIARDGVAELTKIRDDIKATVATLISGGRDQLMALQALTAQTDAGIAGDGQGSQSGGGTADPTTIAATVPNATADQVTAASQAHAAEMASGTGTPMTAQTAATQAAAGAGADPDTAAAVGAAVAIAATPAA